MTRTKAIDLIRHDEAALRQLGVVRLCLFGSTAREEARRGSDVDIAVRLEPRLTGLQALGCLDRVRERLTQLLNAQVDLVPEPEEPGPLKDAIARDGRLAFA